MKILVTGHRGLLGSACVRKFSALGHEVVVTNCDLRDEKYLEFWFKENLPEAVIHCAAKVGGVKANRDQPVDFLLENLRIQNSVIRLSAEHGVKKLVNVATSCLYPRNASVPVKEESLLTGPFEPDVAAYAAAKLAGYYLCRAYRKQHGKNFITVAPCNLYGPGDNYGPSAHVIPGLIKKMHEVNTAGGALVVWGDGKAVREFLYVDDAADAIALALTEWNSSELLNIGTGSGTTIARLVETLSEIVGYRGVPVWDTSQPTGIPEKTFDISKLKALGWSPKTSLEEGLRLTWADYQNNPDIRK